MKLLNSTPPKIIPLILPLHVLPPFKLRGSPIVLPVCTSSICALISRCHDPSKLNARAVIMMLRLGSSRLLIYSHNYMFYLSKRAGLFQAPPKMVEQTWEWVLPRYAAMVYQTTKDIRLKEAAGQDCDFNPDKYQDFETTVPMSLEGWKYDDEDFQTALEEWDDMFGNIKVLLYASQNPEFVGQYSDENNTIDIILDIEWLNPPYNQYENLKQSIYRNIEHEVIHLGQYIFKHFKNLEFGGMPSKRISDPSYTPEGQQKQTYEEKKHPLRDIEFYTILNDAKIELQKQYQQWPDMHDALFKRFVGIIPSFQQSAAQQFFLYLKQHEPEKWRKAVKELYKIVNEVSINEVYI